MVWVGPSLHTSGMVFQWASTIYTAQVGQVQDRSSTYRPTPTYTTLFLDQAIKLDEPCSSHYETEKLSKQL